MYPEVLISWSWLVNNILQVKPMTVQIKAMQYSGKKKNELIIRNCNEISETIKELRFMFVFIYLFYFFFHYCIFFNSGFT